MPSCAAAPDCRAHADDATPACAFRRSCRGALEQPAHDEGVSGSQFDAQRTAGLRTALEPQRLTGSYDAVKLQIGDVPGGFGRIDRMQRLIEQQRAGTMG